MEKMIADLEAAIAAEKNKTQALSVMSAHLQSIKERLKEHLKQTAPAPVPEAPAENVVPIQ
jgi:hypothetical protein